MAMIILIILMIIFLLINGILSKQKKIERTLTDEEEKIEDESDKKTSRMK